MADTIPVFVDDNGQEPCCPTCYGEITSYSIEGGLHFYRPCRHVSTAQFLRKLKPLEEMSNGDQ